MNRCIAICLVLCFIHTLALAKESLQIADEWLNTINYQNLVFRNNVRRITKEVSQDTGRKFYEQKYNRLMSALNTTRFYETHKGDLLAIIVSMNKDPFLLNTTRFFQKRSGYMSYYKLIDADHSAILLYYNVFSNNYAMAIGALREKWPVPDTIISPLEKKTVKYAMARAVHLVAYEEVSSTIELDLRAIVNFYLELQQIEIVGFAGAILDQLGEIGETDSEHFRQIMAEPQERKKALAIFTNYYRDNVFNDDYHKKIEEIYRGKFNDQELTMINLFFKTNRHEDIHSLFDMERDLRTKMYSLFSKKTQFIKLFKQYYLGDLDRR